MKIKYLLNSVAVIFLMPLICFVAFGAELPPDVQRLVEQRNNAIQNIDKKFAEELDKLKVRYTKAGELDSANTIVNLIETINVPNNLSKETVQVASPGDYSVHVLNVGIDRLSGLDSKFDWVSNDVTGWDFIRVKWRSSDRINTVTFLKSCEIYLTNLGSFKTDSITVKKLPVGVKAKGPWLGDDKQWYRVTGKEGDSIQCEGGECLIVAKSFKRN